MQLMSPPKPQSLAPLSPPNSSGESGELDTYIHFLSAMSNYVKRKGVTPAKKTSSEIEPRIVELETSATEDEMAAAIFDKDDPASPLYYDASHTALMLLDFQGFTINLCGDAGQAALKKAQQMRDWALKQDIMVLHSVVDVNALSAPTSRRMDRLLKLLETLKHDPETIEEPSEVAFSQQNNEYIVLKPPGVVSALKSQGAMDLLREHHIKSLVISGLSTSGAVLRTAVPATDDGFIVSIVQDACADRDDKHEWLMENVLASRAHVATADEFVKAWEEVRGSSDGKGKQKV